MADRSQDPVLASARREAAVALLVMFLAGTYTITYCYLYGYDRPLDQVRFVLGFPDWVFWGILLPWAACVGVSCWFATRFVRDVELEQEADPEDTGSSGAA